MNIYESSENYLEAILSLRERHGMVRSIDIANELHFSKPSVSVAMKKLRRRVCWLASMLCRKSGAKSRCF